MKLLFVAGAVLALVIGLDTVFAQGPRSPVYPYCLLERGVGGPGAGGEMMSCLYNTWAQCMASKGGNTDTCIINPWLTFPPR